VVYRDGSFSVVGSLESEDVQENAFKDLQLGRAEVREL